MFAIPHAALVREAPARQSSPSLVYGKGDNILHPQRRAPSRYGLVRSEVYGAPWLGVFVAMRGLRYDSPTTGTHGKRAYPPRAPPAPAPRYFALFPAPRLELRLPRLAQAANPQSAPPAKKTLCAAEKGPARVGHTSQRIRLGRRGRGGARRSIKTSLRGGRRSSTRS